MQAVVIDVFGRLPELREVPDPTPSPGGVVLAVEATGLCRSDWHGWMGHDPGIRLPHVPGHEFAGTVAALGHDVRGWRVGDRVTAPFALGCGACGECASGNQQVCERQSQPGFTAWGSFARYVAVDYAAVNLVRLPEEMDFVTAAGLGCRFVTAFRAVVDQGRAGPGEWLAVHGCGGVGLSAIMIGTALGANVIAVDIAGDKLALARELGAIETVDASLGPDVVAEVIERTGGGAHVSIDALGSPATCYHSVANLRRRGRHVQVGLMMAEHSDAVVPMERVIGFELEFLGSHGMQAHRYPEMMEMIRQGRLAPDRLVGRRIGLAEAPQALSQMDRFPGTGVTVALPGSEPAAG